jgi:hypothetical protein
MERRFVVEAKTFSFTARKGNEIIRLEEKRKGFGGFILLGIKGSGWLADAVEEAMEAQMKEDFARKHRDGARVLKVRLGSNKAGCFLEVAVFVEGGRKGVIRIPEGRDGWGWQRFVDELRFLVAQLAERVLPVVPAITVEEVGKSFEDLAEKAGERACASRSKSPVKEQASVMIAGSNLGLQWPSPDCAMEAVRSLAKDFLAKIRSEVDRIIFFGLGLKVDASSGIRRRLGRVLSRLGLKPKLLFGDKRRGRHKACGLRPRPRSLAVPARMYSEVESSSKDLPEGFAESDPGQGKGETSPEMMTVAREPLASIDAGSVLMGRSQSVPEMRTTLTEGVEESLGPMGSTQIVPGTILTATEAADLPEKTSPEFALVLEVAQSQPASLIAPETRLTLSEGVEVSQIPMDPTQTAPELAQTAPVLVLPELPGIVDVGEGSASSATVLPVPKAQLSVHGLTEAQTWFLGWLRDGTRNHNLLGAIDCFEVGTRRSNEVAPPPVCPIELPKLKAKLAGIEDEDRENVVRNWVLSMAARLGVC